MGSIDTINAVLEANMSWLLPILVAVLVISILVLIAMSIRLARVTAKYRALLTGADGKNLEGILLEYLAQTSNLTSMVSHLKSAVEELNETSKAHLQRVGVVRFNAFEAMGGEQSFSVAILDYEGNGVVISSIYGREDNRVYAKPIVKGKSTYPLSNEEMQAIWKAMGSPARH